MAKLSDMVRITAPHFCAGIIVDEDGIVIKAAPILKYMIGWHIDRVESYVRSKGWQDG